MLEQEKIEGNEPVRTMKYAVLDFETTGHGPHDRIIQVGLSLIDNGQLSYTYASYVQPEIPIPRFITELTGISENDVKHAPTIDEVIVEMLPLLDGRILVAHHAAFDVGFLQRMLEECGYESFQGPVLDTMDIVRIFYPEIPSLQLSMLANSLEIPHDRPHQADSDAETTALILIHCLERIKQTSLLTLRRVVEILDPNAVPMIADLSDWLNAICLEREQLALEVETEITKKSFRGFNLAINEWGNDTPIDFDQRADALPDQFKQLLPELRQRIATTFDAYEERTAQFEMMDAVAKALEEDRHLLVEAGTGTGKSLAYLLPAVFSSAKNKQKVVVTTHTINLQEQLRQRDVPLLEQLFPVPFKSAILKGRSHYLCLRKFESKINGRQYEWNRDEFVTAAQMVVWLSETSNGEDDDLHLAGRNRDFWKSVASDSDSCLNRACPWFKRCFFHRARHQATAADVIITNHAMVFTDMLVEHPILPTYNHLIVDEAHHFEEVAVNHLGTSVNYYNGVNALLELYSNAKSGIIPNLLSAVSIDPELFEASVIDTLQDAIGEVISLKEKWESWFEQLYSVTMERMERNSQEPSFVVRLLPDNPPRAWGEISSQLREWLNPCISLVDRLDLVIRDVKEKIDDYATQAILTDANGSVMALRDLSMKLHKFISLSEDQYVYWLEASPNYRSKSMQLNMAPIDVSAILRESIFETKDSVVLTSATLSVGQKFEYFIDQLGLDTSLSNDRLMTLQLASPFDYRNNVLMTIPRDFPIVKGMNGEEEFVQRLVESLSRVAVALQGRMLVLFTSNKMLRQVHERLKEELSTKSIQVFGQGVESNNRSKLTKLFVDSSACVLLGTSSFWEGVDIPGDALSCLAIVRLPFQPPNHPLVEAKCDLIKAQGKNPFMVYSLPQAVLKFKQGFGRLIRTANDRGIVIVYDRRVLDTYYGKYFLYSLPGPKIEHMNDEFMVGRIHDWFYDADSKGTLNENI
jgi:ATP-dependent DNA helicase DinG